MRTSHFATLLSALMLAAQPTMAHAQSLPIHDCPSLDSIEREVLDEQFSV